MMHGINVKQDWKQLLNKQVKCQFTLLYVQQILINRSLLAHVRVSTYFVCVNNSVGVLPMIIDHSSFCRITGEKETVTVLIKKKAIFLVIKIAQFLYQWTCSLAMKLQVLLNQ